MKAYHLFDLDFLVDSQRPYLVHLRFHEHGLETLAALQDMTPVEAALHEMEAHEHWDGETRSTWPSTLPDWDTTADFGTPEAVQAWITALTAP